MASRGRPRYPDILTPREWEVLDLIRLGLTNPQIARRRAVTAALPHHTLLARRKQKEVQA